MAESCESVVSSVVTSVVSHGQTKVAETPNQEDAEISGSLGMLALLKYPVAVWELFYSNATVERGHATSGTERSRMPNRSVQGYLWARLGLFTIPVFSN